MRRTIGTAAIAILVLVACTGGRVERTPPSGPVEIVVDTARVAVARFGGFGAEWDPYEFSETPAVPEVVVDRIRFMRLPFVRVRMFPSWYSDVNNHYDFSNQAIRPLYELLDAA
jgi:hypothetical protein